MKLVGWLVSSLVSYSEILVLRTISITRYYIVFVFQWSGPIHHRGQLPQLRILTIFFHACHPLPLQSTLVQKSRPSKRKLIGFLIINQCILIEMLAVVLHALDSQPCI